MSLRLDRFGWGIPPLMNFAGQHWTLTTSKGDVLGTFERLGMPSSLLRYRWIVRDHTGREVAHAQEDSLPKAIARRLLDVALFLNIPYRGAAHMRLDFVVAHPQGTRIGYFHRRFTITDHYELDLTRDGSRSLDRRLAVALAILLDTAEYR
jgi:hypothetical protein